MAQNDQESNKWCISWIAAILIWHWMPGTMLTTLHIHLIIGQNIIIKINRPIYYNQIIEKETEEQRRFPYCRI